MFSESDFAKAGEDVLQHYRQGGDTKLFQKGIDGFTKTLPALGEELKGNLSEIWTRTGAQLQGLSPAAPTREEVRAEAQLQRDRDAQRAFSEAREKQMAQIRADAAAQIGGKDLATYTTAPLMMTNAGEMVEGAQGGERTAQLPGGRYSAGQSVQRGAVNIYIQKLVSAADRTEQLVQDMIEKAGSPALAAAGG